ncbi:MAG TPA: hypothetical protein VKY19_14205 [Ktedonosporobacter sp.]|jgi:hypothetical protein|nr:hypothetical protein [Ktedonosporobacter sp.]
MLNKHRGIYGKGGEKKPLSVWQSLGIAALAGAVVVVVTGTLETVSTTVQTAFQGFRRQTPQSIPTPTPQHVAIISSGTDKQLAAAKKLFASSGKDVTESVSTATLGNLQSAIDANHNANTLVFVGFNTDDVLKNIDLRNVNPGTRVVFDGISYNNLSNEQAGNIQGLVSESPIEMAFTDGKTEMTIFGYHSYGLGGVVNNKSIPIKDGVFETSLPPPGSLLQGMAAPTGPTTSREAFYNELRTGALAEMQGKYPGLSIETSAPTEASPPSNTPAHPSPRRKGKVSLLSVRT